MRKNYKRLGNYIELIDERNMDFSVCKLLGLTIDKKFIPSVANTIGANMKRYKIIRRNQFACSTMQVRRDGKMPIAILKDYDEAIISQAYPVFKVIDEKVLNPDYLMMWFTRKEFDRQATFHAVGGVRGSIEWVDFLDFKLPIPSIEKQREIVAEYQAGEKKIKTNEQICEKLEATAQALYRHWFVDFEFPNEEDMPYKSSGGAMVYNEELEKEIPEGWEDDSLTGIANYKNGLAMQRFRPNKGEEALPVIKIRELNLGSSDKNSDVCSINIPDNIKIENGDVIFSWSGTLKVDVWTGGYGGLNQHLFKVTSEKFSKWFYYYWTKHHLQEFIRIADGNKTSLGHIKRKHLNEAKVLIPNSVDLNIMDKKFTPILELIISSKEQTIKLIQFQEVLLSRMVKY